MGAARGGCSFRFVESRALLYPPAPGASSAAAPGPCGPRFMGGAEFLPLGPERGAAGAERRRDPLAKELARLAQPRPADATARLLDQLPRDRAVVDAAQGFLQGLDRFGERPHARLGQQGGEEQQTVAQPSYRFAQPLELPRIQ